MRAWLVAAALLPLVAQAQTPASLKDIAVFPERDAPASVLAANESKIAAEVAGQIVELTDAVGGVVPKGAVLARIDARDYELALARARAALDASRARTLQAETQLTRARDLHAKNFISADGLIQRETEAAVQRADVKLNEAQLASAERNLAKCVIRAPFAAVVRARLARRDAETDIAAILDDPIALPGGGSVPLRQLVQIETRTSRGIIKHYGLKRSVTVTGDLDKTLTDTGKANDILKAEWQKIRLQHPNADLDFSGELDDLDEALDAMKLLFLLGLGLIYMILAAQFRSYFQPMMILISVPMAFTGVALGLLISRNPMSLYTLYGVIALTGIAVNSAIVLIDAANERRARGMSVLHAAVYAARRRIVPILITSTTTIGGLASLAFGIGGESLLWQPVAGAIVWGLTIATVMTAFIVPLIYRLCMPENGSGSGSQAAKA